MKKTLFILISVGLILPFFASAFTIAVNNPLNSDTLDTTIDRLLSLLFNISLGLGPLLIIIGAVIISTAGGDPGRIETGKKIIIYTIIGLVVVFLSAGLSALLTNIFSLGGTGEAIGPDGYPTDPQAAMSRYLSGADQVEDPALSTFSDRRNEIDELFGL